MTTLNLNIKYGSSFNIYAISYKAPFIPYWWHRKRFTYTHFTYQLLGSGSDEFYLIRSIQLNQIKIIIFLFKMISRTFSTRVSAFWNTLTAVDLAALGIEDFKSFAFWTRLTDLTKHKFMRTRLWRMTCELCANDRGVTLREVVSRKGRYSPGR